MAQDATQVRVGVTGALYTAPLGTSFPTATGTAWPAGWVDLGLLDDGGTPEVTPTRDVKDINAWQKFFPVRTVKTAEGMEWKFTLIQKSGTSLKLAFGGGTVASLGGGDYRFSPPAASFIDERMVGLEVDDGSIIDRFILARCFVTDTGAIAFKKDEAVSFQLTVRGLEPASGNRWELISNDPALAS